MCGKILSKCGSVLQDKSQVMCGKILSKCGSVLQDRVK